MSNDGIDISNSFGNLPEIPGYIIEKKIGHGGMADVYKGIQKNLNRVVAIKIINSKFIRDKKFSRRFLFEAQTVAKLSHPNIVIIHDVGSFKDKNFIVMEYLDKKLDSIIKQEKKLSIKESLRILKSTAEALKYAHRMGVIHRDIKPDNCMFRADGTPVLVDFGLAKAIDADSSFSQSGMRLGTPSYMSPEQCMGKKIDKRTDIYSLGVMFFKMLTGSVPYDTEEVIGLLYKHIEEPVPELPYELSDYQVLLDGMMKKDREKRIQSADELVKKIEIFENRIRGGSKLSDFGDSTEKYKLMDETQINYPKESESKKRILFLFVLGISVSLISLYFLFIKTDVTGKKTIIANGIKNGIKQKENIQAKKKEDIKQENVIKPKDRNPEFETYLSQAKKNQKNQRFNEALKQIRSAKQINPTNEVVLIEKKIIRGIEIKRDFKYGNLISGVYVLMTQKKYKAALRQLAKAEELKTTEETIRLRSKIKQKITDFEKAQKIKKNRENEYEYKKLMSLVLNLRDNKKYRESLSRLKEAENIKITLETKKLRSSIEKRISYLEEEKKIKKKIENEYRELLQQVIELKDKKKYKESLFKLIDLEKIKTNKETKKIRKEINKKIAEIELKKKIILRKIIFMDLTKNLQSEYYKKTKRIKLLDIEKNTRISGQIIFTFEVNQNGKLIVKKVNDKWMDIVPQYKRSKLKNKMITNISKLKFPSPEDKKKNQVILKNWRVTFKILTYLNKVILQRN